MIDRWERERPDLDASSLAIIYRNPFLERFRYRDRAFIEIQTCSMPYLELPVRVLLSFIRFPGTNFMITFHALGQVTNVRACPTPAFFASS